MSRALKMMAASIVLIASAWTASAADHQQDGQATEMFTFEHEVEFPYSDNAAVDQQTTPTERPMAVGG